MKQRTFGAHWLAYCGILETGSGEKLAAAAKSAAEAGCELFELACNPVNGMGATETAEALLAGGIDKASYCRFFPDNGSLGDPMGTYDEQCLAFETILNDALFIRGLRENGITVDHLTGPSVFGLGKNYDYDRDTARHIIWAFGKKVAPILGANGIQWNIEYLRAGEDNAIGSMEELCYLIDQIGHPNVKVHADIFHMLERGENPFTALMTAGSRLGYVHAHGAKRVAPGTNDPANNAFDTADWTSIGRALNQIHYNGPIVPEPFGAEIRATIPALGEGLPPAIDAGTYYQQARRYLCAHFVI